MRSRLLTIILGLVLWSVQTALAQQITISGKVTAAEDGSPLPGVSIIVKGSSTGTSTGVDGSYNIAAQRGQVLVYSFVGMTTAERTVGSEPSISVALRPDAKSLDEVVVVGYGTQKKANLTGAVSTVDTKVFESRPITDVGRGLQGTTPGLTITTPSGQIGGNPSIKLRGMTGSLGTSGAGSPLILVDNVEVSSLNAINPEDIESMSVLKDGASASIYGPRASFGVILIVTKSGKRGAPAKVNYSNNFSWSTPTTTPEVAPAAEGAEMAFRALQRNNPSTNSFGIVGMTIDQISIQKMREWEAQYGGQDLGDEMVLGRDFEIRDSKLFFMRSWDPREQYLRKWTPQQKHDVSVSGGTEKTNYNLSLGYLGQQGVLKVNPDEFNRYNLNLAMSTDVSKWMEVHAKVLYGKNQVTRPFYFSSDTYDPWYYLSRWPAIYPYGTYEGKPFRNSIAEVAGAKMNQDENTMSRINLGTQLKPLEGLTINADYTYNRNDGHEHQTGGVLSAYNFWATGAALKYEPYTSASYNRVQYNSDWSNRNVVKAYATYEKNLGAHEVKVMAGVDAEQFESWFQSSQKRNLMDLNRPGEIDLATGEQFVDGQRFKWATAGTFGRINYVFKDKYLFEVNGRFDGGSLLSATRKTAFFPSASAGYVISEESFLDFSKPVLSFLKLRASWGGVGNVNSNYSSTVYSNVYRTMPSTLSNWLVGGVNMVTVGTPGAFPKSLTWESVSTLDFGLDSRFFDNRFGASFDWYRRTTSDMYSAGLVLPSTFGTAAPARNFGELQTTGWEVALDYRHSFANGLNLNMTGTLSDFQEKITEFANNKGINSNRPGRVLGEIWGFETDRFFTEDDFTTDAAGKRVLKEGIPSQSYFESASFIYGPGDVKYKDLNGDGKIDRGASTIDDHGDMKVIGNSTPRYQYGLRVGADWKGVDLNFFFQGVGKRDFWASGPVFIPGFRPGEAWYAHQLDYWTPENPGAFYPRPTDATQSNDARNFLPQTKYLLDMSYLRMKNITLGYTLPAGLINRVKLDRLRVYVSGENLFEFDNLDLPIDPEVDYTSAGLNDRSTFGRVYPYSRSFSFGLQVTL
ncbi:MAG: SusC/RagA family TonB-linked outer membrane protein [Adhaeribacter sp.]